MLRLYFLPTLVCVALFMSALDNWHVAYPAGEDISAADNSSTTWEHTDRSNPFDGANIVVPGNAIDNAVNSRLAELGIAPTNICSDSTFVRRVYLDVVGMIPTADETRAFLDDERPDKRAKLIDELLDRDEFADYWAMKWGDVLRVKSEFPINLWPNAVQTYYNWIRTSLKQNEPYDRFAFELLTASGSNFRDGPANFYRAVQSREPTALAQTVALTFMGVRADKWPAQRLSEMAVFFSQVGYKTTGEWKEEIVINDTQKVPQQAIIATFPDARRTQLRPGDDPRKVFANWLITPTNPWFTPNIANRIWAWLVGRGIVCEPDDFRPNNPPSNPELLALLQRELIANHYDLKALYRLILNSRTYQLSCIPRSSDPAAAENFAFYPVRRLEAEVLIDAIDQITGSSETYISPIPEPYTFVPREVRTTALADASISSPFLDLFGRSPRVTGLESERINRPTALQELHLLNSSHIQRKLQQSEKLRALASGKATSRAALDALYLTVLSRYPTNEEAKAVADYQQSRSGDRRVLVDIAWALINTAEFQYRH